MDEQQSAGMSEVVETSGERILESLEALCAQGGDRDNTARVEAEVLQGMLKDRTSLEAYGASMVVAARLAKGLSDHFVPAIDRVVHHVNLIAEPGDRVDDNTAGKLIEDLRALMYSFGNPMGDDPRGSRIFGNGETAQDAYALFARLHMRKVLEGKAVYCPSDRLAGLCIRDRVAAINAGWSYHGQVAIDDPNDLLLFYRQKAAQALIDRTDFLRNGHTSRGLGAPLEIIIHNILNVAALDRRAQRGQLTIT